MAVVQLRNDTEGRAYYRRKLAAGKSPMEAMRALKRRLSNVVYKQMVQDAKRVRTGPGGQVGATLQSSAAGPNPTADSSEKPLPGPVRPVWTLAEARRFIEHVQGDRLYPLWRLLLTTGLRRGELCGLMWRDLEPDQGSLKVCRQRVVEDPTSEVREKPPKSHNGNRTVLLDEATLTTLSTAKTHAKMPAGSRYMFTGRTGQPLRPDNVTSRFNRLAAGAGVRPIGPHQVRHLLVSSLLDDGYGIHEVAERLGHDPGTLMRYYTRVSAARRRQATLHIAELIAS